MKIAYILSSLENAGPINVAQDLVKVFLKNGHFCKVYYFSNKKDVDFPCETKQISFRDNIDWNDFDVVHTHGGRPDLFVLLKKPLRCRAKVISTIHSNIFEDHVYKYGKVKAYFTTRAILRLTIRHDKVIVLSKTARDIYSSYIDNRKLAYIYNTRIIDRTLDIEFADKAVISDFKSKFEHIIGTFCGLHKRKGLEQLIKVMKLLPNVGCIIIGDGILRSDLEKLSHDIGCENQILFLGKRNQAYRYLSTFDAFSIPSRSEGFPLSLLEAMSYGKAIIASDIPIFKEILTSKEALMFELDNINDYSEKIRDAFNNKKELEIKSLYSFNRNYSPEVFYRNHVSVYKS